MMFVFESVCGMVYNCPDMYIWTRPQQRAQWGSVLTIHPVFYKGSSVLTGSQNIYLTFSHEGSSGTSLDSTWLQKDGNWYSRVLDPTQSILIIDVDRLVKFDLGKGHPLYFRTKEDLCWYLNNIYPLDYVSVEDGTQ